MASNKMNINDIIITENFMTHQPSNYKMAECKRNYDVLGCQDRYIVVNRNNELIDGYCMYLVLKHEGISECRVKRSDRKRECWSRINFSEQYRGVNTTYVYGVHDEDPDHKEYVWRLPRAWHTPIETGMKLVVETRRGESTITVTRTEVLNQPPANGGVKKVIRVGE